MRNIVAFSFQLNKNWPDHWQNNLLEANISGIAKHH